MRLHKRGAGLRRLLEGLKPGVIGGLLALLMLVAAACDDKAQPAGPTATGESPGTGAQTQQIPSTPPPSEEGTPPVSRAFVNACTYRAPAPTPTPDLTTPTATPFSNTTPIPYPTESPSAEVVAYPDLPPPALPASVEAWRDAVVHVSVERASGRTRDQQGLVVADGAVLTVLDHRWEIVSLSVEVSGRGVFTAELERFDPRTGAAMLTIEAEDLTVASGDRGRVAPGEPVLLLVRDEDGGELVVKETYASPSLNAPDHLFALHRDYTPSYQRGTVVVAGDGTPIGLASHAGRFYGQSIVWGGLSLRYLPAVLLDSAIHLLERPPSDLGITPAAVAYYGPDTKAPDGPVTRELLAKPVQEALKDLGHPVHWKVLASGRDPRARPSWARYGGVALRHAPGAARCRRGTAGQRPPGSQLDLASYSYHGFITDRDGEVLELEAPSPPRRDRECHTRPQVRRRPQPSPLGPLRRQRRLAGRPDDGPQPGPLDGADRSGRADWPDGSPARHAG